MNAIQLRDILQTDLEGFLGTYTTPKGKTYPAIRIYPPRVDQSWKVEGVEVAIYETPDNSGSIPVMGETLVREWWIVKLVQWDSSKGLSEILNRIRSYFPQCKIISKAPTIDTLQTAIISIYCPDFVGEARCLK